MKLKQSIYLLTFHRYQQSSELIFVDSSSNMDEHNMHIFILCAHSVAGALPIGVVITSDEQMETLMVVFSLLKSIFPNDSFFGEKKSQTLWWPVIVQNSEKLYQTYFQHQIFYFVAFPSSNMFVAGFLIKSMVTQPTIEWKLCVSSGRYCIQEKLPHLMNL